jgi:hypothetical protein
MILGERFVKFKSEVTNLRAILEKSFNLTMVGIQNGLANIANEGQIQVGDYSFEEKGEWICVFCRFHNTEQSTKCM